MMDTPKAVWEPCYADPKRGVAFFDGVIIEADPITDPRWDRVFPVIEEEQIFVCRQATPLLKERRGGLVLDLETGNGVLAIWAARQGCRVIASDTNLRAIRMARRNATRNKVTVVEREADLTEGSIWFCHHAVDPFARDSARVMFQPPTPWDAEDKFEVVFLSSPYTPTCPGVFPARHAAGGRDGQEAFNRLIQWVPSFLQEGGHCIGNQMMMVTRDGQIMGLDALHKVFEGKAQICYTRMIKPGEDWPVRQFLEEQYESYLMTALNPPGHKVREYIAEVDKDNCLRFALIYYDVCKTTAPGNVVFTDLRDDGPVA